VLKEKDLELEELTVQRAKDLKKLKK